MGDRDGRLPRAVALALALVSGVALDLAFPGPGWWGVAAPGIAGLTPARPRGSPPRRPRRVHPVGRAARARRRAGVLRPAPALVRGVRGGAALAGTRRLA